MRVPHTFSLQWHQLSFTDHTPPPGVAPPPGITTANAPPTGPAQLMGPLPPPPMGQVPPMGIHVSKSVVHFFQLLYLFIILSLVSSPYDGRMGDAPSWKVPISPRIPSTQGATAKYTNQATSRYMCVCVCVQTKKADSTGNTCVPI